MGGDCVVPRGPQFPDGCIRVTRRGPVDDDLHPLFGQQPRNYGAGAAMGTGHKRRLSIEAELHRAVRPPSTMSSAPVTKAESSLAR